MNYKLNYAAIIGLCFILCSCSGVNLSDWHIPYMMEVQQGNYITTKQYNQLKTGMTKDQVAFILGRPLTQFMFDQDRWDFIYQDYKNNNLKKHYTITILFDKKNFATTINKDGQLFDK